MANDIGTERRWLDNNIFFSIFGFMFFSCVINLFGDIYLVALSVTTSTAARLQEAKLADPRVHRTREGRR
jgi:hypothetical protein